MKKGFLRSGIASLLILGSTLVLGSCGQGGSGEQQKSEEYSLVSIEISTQPTKTVYYVGDVFDNAGMIVKAKYSDGQERAVGRYEYSREPLALTDTKVTISYTEKEVTKTADVAIEVREDAESGLRLAGKGSGSRVQPIKTAYKVGESFQASSMTVYLQWLSGKEQAVTDYTYAPNGPLALTDTKITVTYHTWTAEVAITVTEA